MHRAVPVTILYFPATQAAHTPPFGPVKPRLQVQAVRATLVLGELEFAGHAVHDAVPDVSLYCAEAQAVHAFAAGHVVSVRSKPPVISAAIAVVASSVRYSSTKNNPAMSPLKYMLSVVLQGFAT